MDKQLDSAQDVADALAKVIPATLPLYDMTIACIGTDRSTGDALGPLVGTFLQRRGYRVIGTLEQPVTALDVPLLAKTLSQTPKQVLAVDSTMGPMSRVGAVDVRAAPLYPGRGVGKELPGIGTWSITACVAPSGFMEYFVLQNTRLGLVWQLAERIAQGIALRFPLTTSFDEVATTTEVSHWN